MMGVYGASPVKRQRRTRARVDLLERQIIDVLAEDHPQSVRHIFYRMTDPRLPEPIDKTRGYRHVQDRCVKLRRSGAIPYAWISDLSRRGYFVTTFDDAGDFLRRMNGLYRADLWRDAECRCEVWCESRSIAGVIQGDCTELAVDLYPCGGFSSISFAHEAAEQHNHLDDDRPLVIVYVGDYDDAGTTIDKALERELRRHLRIALDFRRIAINAEQIAAYDLPTKPANETARRITRTVEAEAMPAHIMRSLLRDAIEALLPAGALRAAKAAEQSERGHLKRMAELLRGGAL